MRCLGVWCGELGVGAFYGLIDGGADILEGRQDRIELVGNGEIRSERRKLPRDQLRGPDQGYPRPTGGKAVNIGPCDSTVDDIANDEVPDGDGLHGSFLAAEDGDIFLTVLALEIDKHVVFEVVVPGGDQNLDGEDDDDGCW